MTILLATSSTYSLTTIGGLDSSKEGIIFESFWHPQQCGGEKCGSWDNRPESQPQLRHSLQSSEPWVKFAKHHQPPPSPESMTTEWHFKSALKILQSKNQKYHLKKEKQIIQANTDQTANIGFYYRAIYVYILDWCFLSFTVTNNLNNKSIIY